MMTNELSLHCFSPFYRRENRSSECYVLTSFRYRVAVRIQIPVPQTSSWCSSHTFYPIRGEENSMKLLTLTKDHMGPWAGVGWALSALEREVWVASGEKTTVPEEGM